jgi:hypothetical protein
MKLYPGARRKLVSLLPGSLHRQGKSRPTSIQRKGGLVGHGADLDDMAERKISYHCKYSNPGSFILNASHYTD